MTRSAACALHAAVALLFAALLLAWPESDAWAKDKPGGRVLATVNGVDITEREVDLVYDRSGATDATAEAADARKRVILSELVRAEALAQWMLESARENADETAVELRLMRRQVLASRAERAARSAVQPLTQQQLQSVVAANPLLFAERRQYTLEEVQIAAPDPKLFLQLDTAIKKGGMNLDAAQRMAVDAGAKTERRVISMGPESMPKPVMEALAVAQVGQMFVVQSGRERGWVLAIRAAVQAPMTGEEALRVATVLVAEQQRLAAIQAKAQEALGRAKITYSPEVTALSIAAAKRAEEARAAAVPASGAASGPLQMQPPPAVAELPQGRGPLGKRALARMAGIALGAMLAGTLALMAVFTVVRFGYEQFWLPPLWPLRKPVSTPGLAVIVLESLLHPKKLKLSQRAAKWLVNLGFVATLLALGAAIQIAGSRVPLWVLGPSALLGWVLGILLLYRFSKSTARDMTRNWRGVSALGVQAAGLLLAASVRWL